MKHTYRSPLTVMGGLGSSIALLLLSPVAHAACTASSDGLTTTCTGTIQPSSSTDAGKAVSVYDAAAASPYSATNFNPNPPTVTVNNNGNFQFINPTTTNLFDKGIIGANYPNTENPAANNWVLNNSGTINLSTNSIANRLQSVISDGQVNQFTFNNTGTISASQTFFSGVNSSLLRNTVSSGVNTATYNGATLNPISAVYTDDNTNTLVLTNTGTISAQGNFAAAIYGRAGDQTIVNSGFIGNTNWAASDALYAGHWAIGNFGGAEFQTVTGSNPDTPIYSVYSSGGQNYINVTADSQTTLTNSGVIKGDILMLDGNPLTMAAALASGGPLPVANSGTNSGPRDSIINNSGTINGNLYLGSGSHQITNTGTLNGNISVDQSPSLGSFAVGISGTQAGTWLSAGTSVTSTNTNQACPAIGSNTGDASCAQSTNVLAYFVGSRIFNLGNSGTLTGNVNIANTTTASQITIGTGITNSASAAGSTLNAPSTATAIQGTLTISGSAGTGNIAFQPLIQSNVIVKDNTWFEIANRLGGNILNASNISQLASGADTAMLSWTPALNTNGNLVLGASVRDAYTLSGITSGAANSLNALMGYSGSNNGLLTLGNQVQALTSDASALAAGEQLRPEINNATKQTIFNVSNNLMRILDNHLSEGHMAGFMGADYNPVNHGSEAYRTLGITPGFWLEGVTFHQNQGTRQGVDGYQGYSNGFAVGFDTHLGEDDEWLLGAMFSTSHASIGASGANAGNSTSIGTNQGFIYSSWKPGIAYLTGMVGVGGNQVSGNRTVLTQGLNSSSNAMQYSARVDSGIPFQTDYATLIPVAYFAYTRVNQGTYTESGGSAALQVNSTFMNSARSGLGGKAVVPLYEGTVLGSEGVIEGAIEFSALWSHEFANTNTYTTASFAAAGDALTFTVPGIGPGRDSGLLGVGTRLNFAETEEIKPSVLLNYFAEIKDQFSSQTGMIQGRIDF
ncbi:autotransporter domain-containing protein [Candidatus Methylospira mobilis]|uniref:Autotransporter domain-containing protein n=1 Tax=Candidatus Methylospira mobilis TaxID=1808979 RepID=A0A5Q0BF77_9GAMM|nr:autotransporter outer membrane beta-barrel domain-containing protein [Candidatus Methylospira mobilis]QFY42525.1 autotransporter domain-containing protein [Candidatus Methylospira mobilis]